MQDVEVFKALSDPTRIKILELIKNEEKCICEIIPETGKSQPNISQHFRVLRNANLIKQQKKGTNIWVAPMDYHIYSIIDQVRRMH